MENGYWFRSLLEIDFGYRKKILYITLTHLIEIDRLENQFSGEIPQKFKSKIYRTQKVHKNTFCRTEEHNKRGSCFLILDHMGLPTYQGIFGSPL